MSIFYINDSMTALLSSSISTFMSFLVKCFSIQVQPLHLGFAHESLTEQVDYKVLRSIYCKSTTSVLRVYYNIYQYCVSGLVWAYQLGHSACSRCGPDSGGRHTFSQTALWLTLTGESATDEPIRTRQTPILSY